MKKIVCLAMMLISVLVANAQLLGEMKLNPRDFIIKGQKEDSFISMAILTEAISSELSVIRQQYRLERNGETYGKNGKSFYGETYTLAIKVAGGLYVSGHAIEPWRNDADYERVNVDKKYKPDYFWCYQRALKDSVYKPVELEIGTEFLQPVNAGKSLWKHQDKMSDFGLSEDVTLGKKTGYMLWAYASPDIQDSAMVVNLRQNTFVVDVKADSTLQEVTPKEVEKVIGGLFVIPKYEGRGRVQFWLAGVAVKVGKAKWALQLLTDIMAGPAEVTKEPGLTPSTAKGSDKSNKKQNKTKGKKPSKTVSEK